MKISTRGRYALRVMIDLAEHNSGDYIPLTDIAGRQEISEKYLESIVSMLSKSGFLMSLRGICGHCDRTVRAEMAGGEFSLHWNADDNHVYLTGPATFVFDGEWAEE